MRVTTIQCSDISTSDQRLDPPFYRRKGEISHLVENGDTRTILLADALAELNDGVRLPVSDDGVPMLRLNNLEPCEVDFRHLVYVSPETGSSWPKVRPGDVLLARSAVPFRAAVVPPDAPSPLTVSAEISVLRPQPAIIPEYLATVLSTNACSDVLQDLAYRRHPSALQRLRLRDIAQVPIPLPRRGVQEEVKRAYAQASDLTLQAYAEIERIVRAVHAEIDAGIHPPDSPAKRFLIQRSRLGGRWDVGYAKGRLMREVLIGDKLMRPLLEIARPVPSSLKGIDENDLVLAIQADHINEKSFLVEGASARKLRDLSSRMRQPLSTGDVLLCTTGAGQQVAYLDSYLSGQGLPILGSATFTALRFTETPCFFAVSLAHPLVRTQIDLLAVGSVQRFVNKRDLDDLLIPCLSLTWREDFYARMERALERRREALAARAQMFATIEAFIGERWKT
jgi:hypothetical protein